MEFRFRDILIFFSHLPSSLSNFHTCFGALMLGLDEELAVYVSLTPSLELSLYCVPDISRECYLQISHSHGHGSIAMQFITHFFRMCLAVTLAYVLHMH